MITTGFKSSLSIYWCSLYSTRNVVCSTFVLEDRNWPWKMELLSVLLYWLSFLWGVGGGITLQWNHSGGGSFEWNQLMGGGSFEWNYLMMGPV